MKETIGQYEIITTNSSFTLNRSSNSKSKFDLFFSGLLSLAFLIFTIFIGIVMLDGKVSGLNIVFVIICVLGCLIIVSDFILRCLNPLGQIITFNDLTKKIIIKYSSFKKTTIHSTDLNKLEYEMIKSLVRLDTKVKTLHYIEVYAITKTQKRIKMFDINSSHIFDVGNHKVKKDLLINAKPLVKKIAKKLDLEARYNGTIERD